MLKIFDKPLVSILMTAYNREKYIAEAIESVLASTYQNWELIIVDDVSKDKTVEIAKSYQVKDNRIKVYINEKNLGDYNNRNMAASYARGKYLKYLDADDLVCKKGIENMVSSMEKFPEAKLGLIHFDEKKYFELPKLLSPREALSFHLFEKGILYVGPTGTIFVREIFALMGAFDPKFRVASDYHFNMKLASNYPILLLDHESVYYRIHEGQEYKKWFSEYEYLNQQIHAIYLYDKKSPLNTKERNTAIINFEVMKYRKVLKSIIQLKIKKFLDLYKIYNFRIKFIPLVLLPKKLRQFFA